MENVTPEMVEKASALPCKCGRCIAEFAASAVQDAVRECAKFVSVSLDSGKKSWVGCVRQDSVPLPVSGIH